MLIDTHCHIHDKQFFPSGGQAVYGRAIEAGVQMIVVGTSEADSQAAVDFASGRNGVWAVVGVHPHDASSGCQGIGGLLASRPTKLVGIGEIGLDYFYDNSPRLVQQEVFEQQLQWAMEHDLPVSFHVRDAFDDFWPIFDNFSGIRGVLHSFTDKQAAVERALKRGLYIGVNGISTFTKDQAQQELFANLPLGSMLLETDAPFLTPVPYRGKVNEPAFVREVAAHHARIRKISLDEVAAITSTNADKLFGFSNKSLV